MDVNPDELKSFNPAIDEIKINDNIISNVLSKLINSKRPVPTQVRGIWLNAF